LNALASRETTSHRPGRRKMLHFYNFKSEIMAKVQKSNRSGYNFS
jgi:hypothetical protein